MQTSSKRPMTTIVIAAVVVVVLLALGLGAWKMMAKGDAGVKKDQYQAVFMTNGQVYFGKLSDVNSEYVVLKDIYYLQVQQAVQPAENEDQQGQQAQLVKLGNELHGPEDEMMISRDQVLFWENLKNDGKVVDTINKNKSGQ